MIKTKYPKFLTICVLTLACITPACRATEEDSVDVPYVPCVDYPAWAPDGAHIAFQSDHVSGNLDIWVIHPDGTGLDRVTTNPARETMPHWSPDSSSLYFVSSRDGGGRVWKRVLSSGSETRVSAIRTGNFAVSHSGDRLIVELTRGNTLGLAIISAATGAEIRWLAAGRRGAPATAPTWSPNDQEAAFFEKEDLWARSTVDGSNLRQLTNIDTPERVVGRAEWGPAGFIAFDSQEKLYKVRPNGTDLTCIFEDPATWVSGPSWSPDGTKLVFARILGDTNELWTINADGTGLTQLTHTAATPTFSPPYGVYSTDQSVTISCATTGATIRYTTDGSDPTETSTEYTSPVTVAQSLTLKAKAWKTDYFPSLVKTGVYTLKVATPVLTPSGQQYYNLTDQITITCSTPGATIHCTTDGTDPTEDSPVYSTPIPLVEGHTIIKAIAFKTGYTQSDMASGDYEVPP